MSVFRPYIAISPTYANLELPVGFKPDDTEILVKATPEERAVVINTGCVVLRALLDKKDELSEDQAFKKGKEEGIAAELKKWQREKTTLEAQKERQLKELNETVSRLQNEIKMQTGEITKIGTKLTKAQAEAKVLRESELETINNTRIKLEEENKSKIDWLSSELNIAKKAADNSQIAYLDAQKKFLDDIEKLKKDFDSTLDRTLKEFKSEGLSERDRLTKELKEARDLSEKYLSDCREAEEKEKQWSKEKFSEITNAVEKVIKEWSEKYDELNEKYMQKINRQANSSVKGKDNEDAFADLLVESFGTAADFKILDKQIESGDHIIQWEKLKLMFENKDYKTTIPKKQVGKAQRDFKNRNECDVLIVVSQDTDIVHHQHAGGLDITHTLDGRPEIWIGKFGLIEDKIRYLHLLGVVIRQLVRLQKREEQSLENSKDSVDQTKKIEHIRKYFQDTSTDLNKIDTEHKNYQRAQNAAWKLLKDQIKVTIDNFQERLEYAMKDGNDFEEDHVIEIEEVESDAASKTPASSSKKTRKTHATLSKAKKARNSEIPETGNSIRNFSNKIPGSASENPAGQDALSGPTPN
uniref:Uncharacterized protein n=1 Tax=Daphnia magna TaxID=35525 RepID=A0A0N8ENT2_9CRUS